MLGALTIIDNFWLDTLGEKCTLRRMNKLFHDKETISLHEAALNLTNVNGGVNGLSQVHHNVSFQHLSTK